MTSRELTSGLDFWSCGHLRIAVMHLPTNFGANSSIQFGVIDIFRNPLWWATAIIDVQVRWIWHIPSHVSCVVLELCAKFGSDICYSHWDRRIYAPDVDLMTSRELTSGFDFWSRGHLRMTVMHLPTKFGADVFIRCGDISISQNSRWPPSAILHLLGAMGPPTQAYSWCEPPCKNMVFKL